MEKIEPLTFLLIVVNALVTYKGLKEVVFLNTFSFNVDKILINKDYKRIITAGFLHVDWMHFSFNIITLYFFGSYLETYLNPFLFLTLYTISLVGGNLFALYIHRNHSDYSAIGASGAISGLVFASIALFPEMKIGLILFPISFPAWLYGIAYVLYSIYGIQSQKDNIAHEAHLGGGIAGLLFAIVIKPMVLITNYIPILLIIIPTLIFLFLLIKKPHFLIVSNPFSRSKGFLTIEDKYNATKVSKEKELNAILDKINKKGYDKLSKKDKERLEQLSK